MQVAVMRPNSPVQVVCEIRLWGPELIRLHCNG